jgi:hypothetical protein
MVAEKAIEAVVFGHAIYESLALGVAPARAAAIVAPRSPGPAGAVAEADAALERALSDPARLLSPRELLRADVAEMV